MSAKGFKFSNQNLSKKIKVRNNNVRQVTPPLNTRKRVKFISRYSSPLPNTFLSALFPKATTGLEYKFPFSIKKGLKKTASKKKYKISFISSLKLFTEKRKGKSFYNFNPWISTYIFKKPVPFGNIFYGRVLSKQMLNLIVDKHW